MKNVYSLKARQDVMAIYEHISYTLLAPDAARDVSEKIMEMIRTLESMPEGNPLYKEIRIWDMGSGFDPDDIPHLFERFYRGKRAVGNGIGIGLSLAQSILELQNGTISAYNLQNGGACFEIRVYSH